MYTLYHFGPFDRGARVKIALEEHQVEYSVEKIQFGDAAAMQKLSEMNPFGTAPVLVRDGAPPCFDSAAALSLLGMASDKLSIERSETGFVLSQSLFQFLASTVDSAVASYFRAKVFMDNDEMAAAAYPDVQRYIGVIDAQLGAKESNYVAGEKFTNADILLLHLSSLLNLSGVLGEFKNLAAYVEAHKNRDSIKAVGIFDQAVIDGFINEGVPALRQAFAAAAEAKAAA